LLTEFVGDSLLSSKNLEILKSNLVAIPSIFSISIEEDVDDDDEEEEDEK
jgi:hypothetical protein